MLNLKFAGISDPTANTKQTAVGGTPAFSANMEIMDRKLKYHKSLLGTIHSFDSLYTNIVFQEKPKIYF